MLLVDDKASIRGAMKKILNDLGFRDITQAVDGEEAWLALVQANRSSGRNGFDLIVSDLEMPKMSGLELLRAVRENEKTRQIPFIMATTVTAKDIILETMKLGVQAYIIKPFDFDTVALKLRQAGVL